MKWLEDEKLKEAMELVPLCEAFVKAVKSAVKAKLEEDPESVPGFKLRDGGKVTSYDAKDVADIIMESNILGWDALLQHMKFSLTPFISTWADHTGMTKAEAKKDLNSRLSKVAKTKPKASSIVKTK
jgi:hypothetical protein